MVGLIGCWLPWETVCPTVRKPRSTADSVQALHQMSEVVNVWDSVITINQSNVKAATAVSLLLKSVVHHCHHQHSVSTFVIITHHLLCHYHQLSSLSHDHHSLSLSLSSLTNPLTSALVIITLSSLIVIITVITYCHLSTLVITTL